jgi:hypothetical protein
MEWANSELAHVGRIAGMEDPDLQYAYAQSTLNGMLYLRNALKQMVEDPEYERSKGDLLRMHNSVVRVAKHLIKDYDLDLKAIEAFNTRHTLGDLTYLNEKANNNKGSRAAPKNNVKKTRKAKLQRGG